VGDFHLLFFASFLAHSESGQIGSGEPFAESPFTPTTDIDAAVQMGAMIGAASKDRAGWVAVRTSIGLVPTPVLKEHGRVS
jgi:hypothetical protein